MEKIDGTAHWRSLIENFRNLLTSLGFIFLVNLLCPQLWLSTYLILPHWPHALCLIIEVWWIWSGVLWKSNLYKIPSSKLTWQWKSTFSNREYIFKWWIFHCYVSLLEGSLRTMFITTFDSKHKSKMIRLSGGVIEKWCQFRFLNACHNVT